MLSEYKPMFNVMEGMSDSVGLNAVKILSEATNSQAFADLFVLLSSSDKKTAMGNMLVTKPKFIVPVFSPTHAVYAVFERRVDNTLYFATFNGGYRSDLFHGAMPVLVESDLAQFLLPCVYIVSDHEAAQLVNIIADNYDTEHVFVDLSNALSQYDKCDGQAMFAGLNAGFENMEVCVSVQVNGNCAAHNLIQAIRFCERTYSMHGVVHMDDLKRTLRMCIKLRVILGKWHEEAKTITNATCVSRAQHCLTAKYDALKRKIEELTALAPATAAAGVGAGAASP